MESKITSKNQRKRDSSTKTRHSGILRPRLRRFIRGAMSKALGECVGQMVRVFVIQQCRRFLDPRTVLNQFKRPLLPLFRTKDMQEGIRAFMEKREAKFEGR